MTWNQAWLRLVGGLLALGASVGTYGLVNATTASATGNEGPQKEWVVTKHDCHEKPEVPEETTPEVTVPETATPPTTEAPAPAPAPAPVEVAEDHTIEDKPSELAFTP